MTAHGALESTELQRCAFLLFASVLVLMGFGAVMVYSATGTVTAERDAARREVQALQESPDTVFDSTRDEARSAWWEASLGPVRAHATKIALGLALLVAASFLPYHYWARWSAPLYVLSLLLLALVLIPGIGHEVNGGRRWFRIPGLGFALQPSEIAKFALIVFLARCVSRRPLGERDSWWRFAALVGAVGGPALLIAVEPDFGTALLVGALGLGVLVVAGLHLGRLTLAVLLSLPLLALLVWLEGGHVLDRFARFGDPAPDSQAGFALTALRVGGLAGVGLGAGRYKLFFLSETEDDFILAVIGEELGFFGITMVVMLFALLLWSGVRILQGLRESFGFHLAAGVLFTIAMQALINIAVASGSVPVKGMPLPFVSAGGSSLAVLCLGVGVVLNVTRRAGHVPVTRVDHERVLSGVPQECTS